MHMHRIIEQQLRAYRDLVWSDVPHAPLEILEVGTIRRDTPQHERGDGWSTIALARDAHAHGGHVTSVDLDVNTSRDVIRRHGLLEYVTYREGYSIEWLAAMLVAGKRFDVVLLDSENDDTLTFHEYLLAQKLRRKERPMLILVDDVVEGSDTQIKGRKLLPWVNDRTTRLSVIKPVVIPRTGDGFMSGVLSVIG